EQKSSKFSKCQGLRDTKQVIWEKGKFVEVNYSSAFYSYQREMSRQRDFMDKVLSLLKNNNSYTEFISNKGVLHSPIPSNLFDDFIILTNLQKDKIIDFLEKQKIFMSKEIKKDGQDSIFADTYNEFQKI
ncbi:MAG: hypothetical protein N2738_06235, partial [Thermodesulfovibrionales bacterium]|nr:hypothetical protein [Thermodesulfovibrionales bacterium]